ncbi:MAG: hypothetical protein M1819_001953 [Sarea resinae]|nr:MAG: hypothetical protein M1819_001953 [Sarea resinae]
MPFGDFPIHNKIVVITGAGSGINLAFARLVHEKGARVVIGDIRLNEDAEAFVKKEGVIFVKCDVAKRADLQDLITVAEKEYGDVPDVYVPGAGVCEPAWSNFYDDTEEDDYAQININLVHPLKFSRMAIRALLGRNKKGVIMLVSSTSGIAGTYALPLYCATKHGLLGFVRSMVDSDPLEGVKVVAVCPGLTRTAIFTPSMIDRFGLNETNTLEPEVVASRMVDLVELGKYEGGTILEVSAAWTRTVGTFNIAAPASDGSAVPPEAIARNNAPIVECLKRERGVRT